MNLVVIGDPRYPNVKDYALLGDTCVVKRRSKTYLCTRKAKVGDEVQCLLVWDRASKLMGKGKLTSITHRDNLKGLSDVVYTVDINGRDWPLKDPLFVKRVITN